MQNFICTICGDQHEGSAPPVVCKICKQSADKFNIQSSLASLRRDIIKAEEAYNEAYNAAECLRNTSTFDNEIRKLNNDKDELRNKLNELNAEKSRDMSIWSRPVGGEEHLGPDKEYARMKAEQVYGSSLRAIENKITEINNRLEEIDYSSAMKKVQELVVKVNECKSKLYTEERSRRDRFIKAKNQVNKLVNHDAHTLEKLRNLETAYVRLANTFADLCEFDESKEYMRTCNEQAAIFRSRWRPMQDIIDKESRDKDEKDRLAKQAKDRFNLVLLYVQVAIILLFLFVLFGTEIVFSWREIDAPWLS